MTIKTAHEQLVDMARQIELSSPSALLVEVSVTLADGERTFTIRRSGDGWRPPTGSRHG